LVAECSENMQTVFEMDTVTALPESPNMPRISQWCTPHTYPPD